MHALLNTVHIEYVHICPLQLQRLAISAGKIPVSHAILSPEGRVYSSALCFQQAAVGGHVVTMCETRNIHRMSIGKSLVYYPIGTMRIRLAVIRGGWNCFRIISHDCNFGF
jgi:hypothetical protein